MSPRLASQTRAQTRAMVKVSASNRYRGFILIAHDRFLYYHRNRCYLRRDAKNQRCIYSPLFFRASLENLLLIQNLDLIQRFDKEVTVHQTRGNPLNLNLGSLLLIHNLDLIQLFDKEVTVDRNRGNPLNLKGAASGTQSYTTQVARKDDPGAKTCDVSRWKVGVFEVSNLFCQFIFVTHLVGKDNRLYQ